MANVWKTAGGSECVFSPPLPEELNCVICHLVLRDPVQTICGHRFCKECLSEFHKSSSRSVCALDNEELDPEKDIFPDNATRRHILSHCVKCQNEECGWTGQLREFENHECLFHVVKCQKGECSAEILRKDLAKHQEDECRWRDYQCRYCNCIITFWKKPVHHQKCGKAPVKCTNRSKECDNIVILREELKDHLKNHCPLGVVRCQYRQVGCKEKLHRYEMQNHLDSQVQNHLQLACEKVNHLSKVLRQVKKLEIELEITKTRLNIQPFIWKITDFQKYLEIAKHDNVTVMESDPFYSGPNGYKFRVKIFPNGYERAKGAYLSIFVIFCKGDHDAILPWPFLGKITMTLIDQQEHGTNVVWSFCGDTQNNIFERPTSGFCFWGFPEFIAHDVLNTRKYIVDNTIFIKVNVSLNQ